MYTLDDSKSPNSGEYDKIRPAGRPPIKLKEVVNSPGRRSSGDSRILLRFKLSSPPEIGSVRNVTGDDEKISETKEIPNHRNSTEDRSTTKVFLSPNKPEAIATPLNPKREQQTASNTPPQPPIGNSKCEKKSARLQKNYEKAERAKFSLSLSRHEIEQDFFALTGKKPPGKPKKRPRVVQNQINDIFPGQSLTEVHADQYKVKEKRRL